MADGRAQQPLQGGLHILRGHVAGGGLHIFQQLSALPADDLGQDRLL
ncbi:hypothetical protein ACFQFQ_18805 [Sulfitobacter porphyrae]|uniref:Uncharacterized protein n=1 Tax=Sulfitobacter porphyrae TaxID=1246864 RepID=A0ABW2B632_9RHOB